MKNAPAYLLIAMGLLMLMHGITGDPAYLELVKVALGALVFSLVPAYGTVRRR